MRRPGRGIQDSPNSRRFSLKIQSGPTSATPGSCQRLTRALDSGNAFLFHGAMTKPGATPV